MLHPPPWDAAFALADYAFPWNRLISDFKYAQQPELARPLAEQLARQLLDADERHTRVDWVTAVPMTPVRLAERGYNQAWELARALAAELGLPCRADLIARWRAHTPQATLGLASRATQPHGAFMPHIGRQRLHTLLQGKTVALVDDVLTTGATAAAATRALREAGASSVVVWVLARTPPGQSDNADHVSHRLGSP